MWEDPTFFRRLSQKLAMSSAEVLPATLLLQNDSNASFSALWKRELLAKQSVTYCDTTFHHLRLTLYTQTNTSGLKHQVKMYIRIHDFVARNTKSHSTSLPILSGG